MMDVWFCVWMVIKSSIIVVPMALQIWQRPHFQPHCQSPSQGLLIARHWNLAPHMAILTAQTATLVNIQRAFQIAYSRFAFSSPKKIKWGTTYSRSKPASTKWACLRKSSAAFNSWRVSKDQRLHWTLEESQRLLCVRINAQYRHQKSGNLIQNLLGAWSRNLVGNLTERAGMPPEPAPEPLLWLKTPNFQPDGVKTNHARKAHWIYCRKNIILYFLCQGFEKWENVQSGQRPSLTNMISNQ